jgi:hypothetical protein
MFWVDMKIGVAHVGDACGNVIRLVDGEAIKAGGYSGADYRSAYQHEQHQNEEARAYSMRAGILDCQKPREGGSVEHNEAESLLVEKKSRP